MASRLPDCVAEVDKQCLCQTLPGLVDADVLNVVHGTATKIHPELRHAEFHGIDWVFCPPEMQPEENCEALAERFCTAVDDLGSIHLIHQGA